MRDINRIPAFMEKLSNIWMTYYPDLRFAQFMEFIFSKIKNTGRDPFYLEEDQFIKYIEKIVKGEI